ncbi:hypothetical protein P5673_016493 [Acropora cervicornis]|uniref:Uncharacterized protein n=1 Tax=Acropora cervicornis TaxID=6130 RepID=A0AAD9QG89_ACRCE|nr:hypothetical protein P5673_016493 [Acropora cervicornis]
MLKRWQRMQQTDIEERKDQFLRTIERLLKPSARGGKKKKGLGWRKKEKKTSTIQRKDLVSQSDYLTNIYSLSGEIKNLQKRESLKSSAGKVKLMMQKSFDLKNRA